MVDVQIAIEHSGTLIELARLDLEAIPRVNECINLFIYDSTAEKEVYSGSYEVFAVLHYFHSVPVVPIGKLNFIEYNSNQDLPTVRILVKRLKTRQEHAAQFSLGSFSNFLFSSFEYYLNLSNDLALRIFELVKQGKKF